MKAFERRVHPGNIWKVAEANKRRQAERKSQPEALAALEQLAGAVDLRGLDIRDDFRLINAHAHALKVIHNAREI